MENSIINLLYISSSLIPSDTANSIQVMKMCSALSRKVKKVVLLSRSVTKINEKYPVQDICEYYDVKPNFSIFRLNWPDNKLGGVQYGIQVAKFLNQCNEKYDLVYGRSIYGLLAAVNLGIPLIYEVHTPPNNVFRHILETILFKSKNLKKIVFISESLMRKYLSLFPYLTDRFDLIVAHDASDPLSPRAVDIDMIPRGNRKNVPQIGYVGHLHKGKGPLILIELAGVMQSMDFHIVGGGLDEVDFKYRKSYPNLFFHGFVAPKLVDQYIHQFDILLLPAQEYVSAFGGKGRKKENISQWMSPLKLFEYMASQKPIIASRLPVLEEVLTHRVNALLVPPRDINAWKEAILEVSRDSELAVRISRNAYLDFNNQYTWDKRVEKILF
jgi:glycosyltransferase involved in cell wall biosynthesis